MSIAFTVYGHPFGKQRPRATKAGHVYTPERTVEEERNIRAQAVRHRPPQPLEGPLKVCIVAYFAPPKKPKGPFPTKKPDADNCAKAILDSLNGIMWTDDAQVVSLHVLKVWDATPRVMITVEPMAGLEW